MSCNVLFFVGDFAGSVAHAERALALYDPQQHSGLAFTSGQDPQVVCQSFAAWGLWMLGYPDQARQRSLEAIRSAQRVEHSHSLALATHFAAVIHWRCGEWRTAQALGETVVQQAQEQGLSLWEAVAAFNVGWARVGQGIVTEGLAQMQQAMASYPATGAEAGLSVNFCVLAHAYSAAGQMEAGLAAISRGMVFVQKNGERILEAELHRVKGELLLNAERRRQNDERNTKNGGQDTAPIQPSSFSLHRSEEAEACFLKAIDISRQQQAKMLELRAATSLSRLWSSQGKKSEARILLSDVYAWFTEGFDTSDMREAKVLLEELSQRAIESLGDCIIESLKHCRIDFINE
jgi:predicted ATPase